VIRILPCEEAAGDALPTAGPAGVDPLAWAAHRRFVPSGRAALEVVLRSLALEPEDEVVITNTTGQTYISACVTCTVFNHCQPSRVLTDRTRAIVAIHEFGFPHPDLSTLKAQARERGIPLIEDCAHTIDSVVDGAPLGSYGDFAIFSLSKILPVAAGGVLVSAQAMPDLPRDLTDAGSDAEAVYAQHLPAIASYSRRRRENHDAVRRRVSHLPLLLEPDPGVTPWFAAVLTPDASDIRRRSSAVQWGSTMRDDLLLVTTNPFVEADDLVTALDGALRRSEAA
jgi:hypothetical protein